MSNFAASTVSSTFDIAFCQHEPGAQATTLIDCPFSQSHHECLRYFTKSYDYNVALGSVNSNGAVTCSTVPNLGPTIPILFKRPMAKAPPTIGGWSDVSGAAGNVRDRTAGTDRATSSALNVGQNGMGGFGLTTTNAGNAWYTFHYSADTGW
jgi:hypothetical protein